MFVRTSALLGGSVAAAASALSVANANASVKEPATGIGAPYLFFFSIHSLIELKIRSSGRVRITERREIVVGSGG